MSSRVLRFAAMAMLFFGVAFGRGLAAQAGVIELEVDARRATQHLLQTRMAMPVEIAVNTRRYAPEVLKTAVRESTAPNSRIDLLLENSDLFATHELDYHGGARHPRLERIADVPDLLSKISAPRTWKREDQDALK